MRDVIVKLRREMAKAGVDTYLVFSADAHQSEYVAPYWRARAYLSGFTGSAGTLAVTAEKAALWTDGRYFLQAEAQLKDSGIELMKMAEPGVPTWQEWILAETKAGGRVGVDGRTIGAYAAKSLAEKLSERSVTLDTEDLTDKVWPDRPALPEEMIFDLPAKFSGETREERLERLRKHMEAIGAEHYLVCSLESSAWLLNYRGNDVEDTPVAYAYTLVGKTDVKLFIEPGKVPEELKKDFAKAGVEVVSYHKAADELARLSGAVAYDPLLISLRLASVMAPAVKKIEEREAPLLWRAVKTENERENLREAHRKDGAVMVRFIRQIKEKVAEKPLREDEIADILDEMRRREPNSLGISFSTIAGYEDNGAIIHYAPEPGKGKTVEPKGFLLVDSGAQYLEGTTDITRTLAMGPVSDREKEVYTLVLKGHIGLARAVFHEGTSGPKLDVLARTPLWEHGLDFKHGTGHGVGYVLSVHEGPHTVNTSNNNVALVPGMVVTDEPGFYEAGAFGVRIENMLLVKDRAATEWGRFYEFENLTLVPYERDAIDVSLLTAEERAWIDRYHARVREELSERLSGADREWLEKATEKL